MRQLWYATSDDGTLPAADSGTVGAHPAYPPAVDGTAGDDTMAVGYTDGEGQQITTGDDTVIGDDGDDAINAGADNDTIIGDQSPTNDGEDTLSGGAGDDTIFGDSIADDSGVAETTIMSWAAQGIADEADVSGGMTGVTANGDISVTLTV